MKKIIKLTLLLLVICPVSIFAYNGEGFEIHGFISQGYLKSDNNNYLAETEEGTFEFNEMGLNFGTWVGTDLRIGMQFFARDLGKEGNDKIVLDWAIADYRWKEWLGLRVGKMKLAAGVFNESRDMDMIRTSALLPQSLYPELYRDTFTSIKGIGAYGDISMNMMGIFSYNLQIGVLPIKTDGGFAKAFQANVLKGTGLHFSVDTMEHDYYYTAIGKWETPLSGLKIGGGYYDLVNLNITGAVAEMAGAPYLYEVTALDGYYWSLEYSWENLMLLYENTYMNIEGILFANTRKKPNSGWYLGGSYRFTELFELGLTYSEYYPDSDDKTGESLIAANRPAFLNWLKDSSVSLRFDINDFWILKLEYHYMDGFGAFSTADNVEDELEENCNLYVLKVIFNF